MLEMKQPLETIIQKLETDPLYAIRITDADSFKTICTNKTGAEMIEDSESIEGFFNDLFASGVKSIVIQPRRRNGNTFRDAGNAEKISFAPKDEPKPQNTTYPTSHALTPEVITTGLMGGLNAQAIYHHMDYPKVVARNEKLEFENAALKEKIEQLKEKALEDKFSEAKATGSKDMLQGLMALVPDILTAVGTMKAPPVAQAAAGLAQPEIDLSPVKENLISKVKTSSDAVNHYILLTYEGVDTMKGFGEELEQLLINYKLIETNEP